MAVPAFVGAGTGVVVQTDASPQTVSKTGVTIGNIIFFQYLVDGSTATHDFTTFTGLEKIDGTDGDMDLVGSNFGLSSAGGVFIGRATATTVSVLADTGTSGTDLYCRIYEFSGASDATSLGSVVEGSTAGDGGTAAVSDQGVTTTGPDRLALNFVQINDDNAMGAFTGMTGGTWAEVVAEYATATGTDGCLQVQSASMASAGTINGGSYTMAAGDDWTVVGFALLPYVPPPTEAEVRERLLMLRGMAYPEPHSRLIVK